eukprot:scaffold1216_cov136-Amphora_coffeaeformis.AAC.3
MNSNWAVRLSLHKDPKKNSDLIISIDCGDESTPLSLSEAVRDVVEHTPDFMVKLCRREQKQPTFKQRAFPLLLKYGCGFMTLILMDGAELPDDFDDVPVALIRGIVDDVSTVDSLEQTNKRIEEQGTIIGEGTRTTETKDSSFTNWKSIFRWKKRELGMRISIANTCGYVRRTRKTCTNRSK